METQFSSECLAKGYDCPKIKKEIDAVLELNSQDRQQLGISSTKTQKNEVRRMERQRLKSVRHLDQDKIDRLLNEE